MSDVDESWHERQPTDEGAGDLLRQVTHDPGAWAVFLDIDGTLLDLALTPDAISVPEALPGNLHALSGRLDGALALVTGRALYYADTLFQPYHFPIAGLHGAELRSASGETTMAAVTPEFQALKEQLALDAEAMPGVVIEDKGASVAAHYRLAPDYEANLDKRMRQAAEQAGAGWALQLGKMVFELRPARASKGDAVEFFLSSAPFAGRKPIAIGDDLTDESMFAVVNARGGCSIRVGPPSQGSCAQRRMSSPDIVRDAIAKMAESHI